MLHSLPKAILFGKSLTIMHSQEDRESINKYRGEKDIEIADEGCVKSYVSTNSYKNTSLELSFKVLSSNTSCDAITL